MFRVLTGGSDELINESYKDVTKSLNNERDIPEQKQISFFQ